MEGYSFDKPIEVTKPNTFEPLPFGSYTVAVSEAGIYERDYGNGIQRGVQLKFEVVEGEYRGRYIFEQLKFEGVSEACKRRSENRIVALAWAAGLPYIHNTSELVDKVVVLDVEIEQREGFSPRNAIRRYRKYEVPRDTTVATTTTSTETELDW